MIIDETVFRVLALINLAAVFAISGYYRRKADREGGTLDPSVGRGLLLIFRLAGLILLLPLIGYFLQPEWVTWARISLPVWLRILGALIGFGMIPIFYWIFSTIGNNISPTQATREDHNLITTGPYHWVRHPLYTASLIFFLSISLVTALWWLAVAILISFTAIYLRTASEERRLLAEFGPQYEAYVAKTGRFFPKRLN